MEWNVMATLLCPFYDSPTTPSSRTTPLVQKLLAGPVPKATAPVGVYRSGYSDINPRTPEVAPSSAVASMVAWRTA